MQFLNYGNVTRCYICQFAYLPKPRENAWDVYYFAYSADDNRYNNRIYCLYQYITIPMPEKLKFSNSNYVR